jgi:phenylpropionate dioxygenase-like ring-hydroxylating dioxygenase large terminal subunit
MLSKEKNELLCRVETGTPMGNTLRENFWIPVAVSSKLVSNGKTIPIRVFGENFVAFRATDGRVGIFNERCPHRGASLLLARNEDNALRCIYHGFKFSVTGQTVEVPTEPHNPQAFCRTVPLRHYQVREAAGVIWVWLGKGPVKQFPEFEWTKLPASQVYATKQTMRCNWLQNVEAGMDSAHVSILHQAWTGQPGTTPTFVTDDLAPIYDIDKFEGGFRYAAIRTTKADTKYIRVSQFIMPWYCFIPPRDFPYGDRLVLMSTPIDDTHVTYWNVVYNPYKPLTPSFQVPAEDPDNFPPATIGGREEAWGQDRGAMARGHFSGFPHLNTEDFAVGESQGPIADRSIEYLNAGDRAVVQLRRQLLDLVEETQKLNGEAAAFPHDKIDYGHVRAYADVREDASTWRNLIAEAA